MFLLNMSSVSSFCSSTRFHFGRHPPVGWDVRGSSKPSLAWRLLRDGAILFYLCERKIFKIAFIDDTQDIIDEISANLFLKHKTFNLKRVNIDGGT